MKLQRHLQKKASSKSAFTPQPNPLQTRPFAPPKEVSPDLQTQRETAEPVGHNFANIPLFAPATPPIQAKLTIGEPGDKYEQEADRVAAQVVRQINAPAPQPSAQGQTVQRMELPEEELQMKPETDSIQRQEILHEEDELQMKPMLQLRGGQGDIAATPELESSIQRLRGSGQPLAEQVREPMEQAFGANFSGVRVHTDAQSDGLNQSIQAKAFTTGQDIFFRQGAYEPGNRGGQELIAHELTHVVQQSGGAVQRKREGVAAKTQGENVIQRGPIGWLKQNVLPVALGGHEIVLDTEESAGGHSLAKHGAHLSDDDMKKRIMGTHPTIKQSRTSMQFNSIEEHRNKVNEAYQHHKTDIEAHFKGGGIYKTWEYKGGKVGKGYTNTGTLKHPTLTGPVEGVGVAIAFDPSNTDPRGYRLDSAYPIYP